MRRLAILPLLLLFAAPGANGAGCSPLSCSPSQVPLSQGRLLAVRPEGLWGIVRVVDLRTGATRWRLPAGQMAANLLVNKQGSLLTWFNVATGARVADAIVQTRGQLSLAGASQNGSRAVLVRSQKRETTFAIVSPHGERVVRLPGQAWGFDALNGDKLYLLHYLRNGYEVRLFDLADNALRVAPLKDQEESARISGTPWVRLSSPDGRYLFTLYISQSGQAMVHELDTRSATARCIDLPASVDFNTASTYALTLSPDARRLYAVSSGDGKATTIDVGEARVLSSFGFRAMPPASPVGGTAAISPNGKRLAVSLAGDLFVLDLARQKATHRTHVAIALGFSTDNRRLWLLGQKSRVTTIAA
jgi:WD40 repeat protein